MRSIWSSGPSFWGCGEREEKGNHKEVYVSGSRMLPRSRHREGTSYDHTTTTAIVSPNFYCTRGPSSPRIFFLGAGGDPDDFWLLPEALETRRIARGGERGRKIGRAHDLGDRGSGVVLLEEGQVCDGGNVRSEFAFIFFY